MSRRDYSSKKSHTYQTARKSVRRDKLKREILKRRLKIVGAAVFLIGFFTGIFYLIFVSPLFAIQTILVRDASGKNEHHEELELFVREIVNEKLWKVPKRNFFLLSSDTLAKRIEETHFTPPIEEVYVAKQWPHMIVVDFKKRIVRFRVVVAKKNFAKDSGEPSPDGGEGLNKEAEKQEYLIDSSGFIVEVGPFKKDSIKEPLPVINFSTERQFAKAMVIANREILEGVVLLDTAFSSPDLHKKVDFFEIKDSLSNEVLVKLAEGYRIYFSTAYPLQTQINNLVSIVDKIGKDKQDKIEYVDMRIEGRAYACCNLGF